MGATNIDLVLSTGNSIPLTKNDAYIFKFNFQISASGYKTGALLYGSGATGDIIIS
jgi:hypothetical protein